METVKKRFKGSRARFKRQGKEKNRRHTTPKRAAIRRGTPNLDPRLASVLAEIGPPEPRPFRPDPFQIRSLRALRVSDVLVSAPTGSGKTWIAQEAIKSCLRNDKKVWYASPLKALSNSIYEEFCGIFGQGAVGILTGDRKENPSAPVIVGTTEILRNQLYDAMVEGPAPGFEFSLVVLDEAHYLGEPDRGVVWEETLIYLPASTRILMLSATIRNTEEIASWLASIRGAPCTVISSEGRPVPLHALFLYPDGTISLLSGRKGLRPEVARYLRRAARKRRRGSSRHFTMDYGYILECLRTWNLLPAIFFLKSRLECDRAVSRCPVVARDAEDEERFRAALEKWLERFPYLKHHRGLAFLENCRVAAHHAGHLPFWKVLVERMMFEGHLDAIFATSTVAGGVNFPARTVVLVQSDRYDGAEFKDLTATELQQMIGRAGRRGKDKVGFAVIVPGPYQDPELIHERLASPPDPIESRLRINFSMVLNLLQSMRPPEARRLLDRSLAAFQQERRACPSEEPGSREDTRKRRSSPYDVREALWREFRRNLEFLKETGFVQPSDELTEEGRWAARLRLDHPLLVAEAIRKGSFRNVSPEVLAGLIAPFVLDNPKDMDVAAQYAGQVREIDRKLKRLKKDLKDLDKRLRLRGFETAEILLWPAAALYLWARGFSWRAILRAVAIEEGDMAMLITRTADHLRQLAGLGLTHPDLAETAQKAIELIYREPVWM